MGDQFFAPKEGGLRDVEERAASRDVGGIRLITGGEDYQVSATSNNTHLRLLKHSPAPPSNLHFGLINLHQEPFQVGGVPRSPSEPSEPSI